MTWDWVRDNNEFRKILEKSDKKHGCKNLTPDSTIDQLIKCSWMLALHKDGDCMGYVLYEWTGDREAAIHVCALGSGFNRLTAWRKVKGAIFDHADIINAYIPLNRPRLAKLAELEGFTITKKRDYYYGQITKTQATGASSARSSTSDSRGRQRASQFK
tara:strand:+ start:2166 stop:2642 length:477 start_codon:yes stop_codon:yes gene_type:complete